MTTELAPSLSASALSACREILAQRSKSFTLASRLLPQETRGEAAVLYAWCRRADDAVDNPRSVEAKRAALDALEVELDGVFAGRVQRDPVLEAFQIVVHRRGILRTYAGELLAGMRMDLEPMQYPTADDLALYCFRAAGTVGLMMSHVLGVSSPVALRHATHLGMAMQLTNICRDVKEDWELGRLYLPLELLEASGGGVAWSLLRAGLPPSDGLRRPIALTVRQLLAIADRYYASADIGLRMLPFRTSVAIRAARLLYAAIGTELAHRGFDALAGRAVVPSARKLRLVAAALLAGAGEVRERWRAPFRRVELTAPPSTLEQLWRLG